MIYSISPKTKSIYIHWPFCPYKCHFCPFVAIAGQDRFMERYQKALNKELLNFAAQCEAPLKLDTIFIGGGTPSTWPCPLLLDTFATLRKIFDFNSTTEVTIEVNPGTVQIEQLQVWKNVGINRLSIGVQSLKDTVLKNLNRHQSKEEVFWVVHAASQVFENLSIDLILGLPGISPDEWKELLHTVVTWPIHHISIYFLTVHEETPLYFRVQKNEINLVPDETMVNLYTWSISFLEKHGFYQYEISNFSKKNYQSKHNTVYWDRKPYKGFGLGACSFDGSARFQNQKNLMKYLTDIELDKEVTLFSELLTEKQVYLERIMLGLRKKEGISLSEITDCLDSEQKQKIQQTVDLLAKHQFLNQTNNKISLTAAGFAVQNDIAARLSL